MVVYVENKKGKKLYCIVEWPANAGPVSDSLGPAARFPRPTSSLQTDLDVESKMSSNAAVARRGSPTHVTQTNHNFPAILIVHGFKGFSTQRYIATISDSLVKAGFLTMRVDLTKNPAGGFCSTL